MRGLTMEVVEMIGVAASAMAGAMVAMDKKADIFGVLFLAIITAFGGGMIRDTMLGTVPRVFTNHFYLIVTVVVALIAFLDAYIRNEHYKANKERVDRIVNIVDALALASYTTSGVEIAVEVKGLDNALLVIACGMITGFGGGMFRDVLTSCMPAVLYKRVYAVASLVGAVVYYYALVFKLPQMLGCIVSMAVIIIMRLLAIKYKWNLPKADI